MIFGDETNSDKFLIQVFQSYRKRKIAVMLALGHYQDAIRDLNEYLKVKIRRNQTKFY